MHDAGCRFPGCTHLRFVDAHHIIHWADGGDTTLDNLTLLCRKHHRFLHEYGFQLERVGRELRFLRPDGQQIADVPRLHSCENVQGCAALYEDHATGALQIDADTAVSAWNGESPRYDGLVALLQERSGVQARTVRTSVLHVKRAITRDDEAARLARELEDEGGQMLREQRETTERMQLMSAMESRVGLASVRAAN
jgi:hypothetical protein